MCVPRVNQQERPRSVAGALVSARQLTPLDTHRARHVSGEFERQTVNTENNVAQGIFALQNHAGLAATGLPFCASARCLVQFPDKKFN
jgi:hypothetical protein